MSLLSTLAKVAVGVAVAKGVSSMASGKSGGASRGGAGTGSIFGGANSRPSGQGSDNPLGDLGSILSGRSGGEAASGGLGGLLESLAGGASGSSGGGGLLDSLSQASRPGGGQMVPPPRGGSLGDMLNQALDHYGEPDTPPAQEHEDAARVMLRAMLQAAKSDGRIDDAEKKTLLDKLGDVSREDMAFIEEELQNPVDIKGLARDVPPGMGAQVYTISLLAIDLDNKNEAQYLHELAQALGVDRRHVNAIHEQMGEPQLYG